MRKHLVWKLVLCAFGLAGCQTSATNCAGWTKSPFINDPFRLVVDEPELSRWIVSTNEYGVSQKCWK